MRVLLLLLLIVSPGCVLTSAANRLSDPTYPEQDAEVAAISSDAVEVVIRGTDGSSERCKVSGFVSRTNEGTTRALGPIRRASVKRAWRRTMHLSPVAIFERREELESVYEVVASDGEAGATREIGILRVPP
ncbi:hypothetical protein HY251_08000, partial [bacterium]|nr:hypothetical protein [bacterium]